MNFKQSFILATKSLMSSKMRSFLTMLGIIIGVASVIVLVSLVDGMSKNITKRFEGMGTNLISVSIFGRNSSRNITTEEIQSLADKNKDFIEAVTPTISVSGVKAKYLTKNIDTSCTGTSESFTDIRNYNVSSGRYLSFTDVERRQKVCVLGSYVAKELFTGVNPISKNIKINGETFTVIGVMEEKASSVAGSDDDKIYAPYNVVSRINKNARIGNYSFKAVSKDTVSRAMEIINSYLLSVYTNTDSFRVFNQADALKQLDELSKTMTNFLVGIASISLLVGGIGIMNIMLVSVTERTREIGIRKALGAKKKDIMSQFVVEAMATSAIGGMLGILLGIVASYLVGNIMKLDISPSFYSVLIAFFVSALIGVTFGYFPANKAAKLNPIDALRYE